MQTSSAKHSWLVMLIAVLTLAAVGCSSRSPGHTDAQPESPLAERTSGGCKSATLPIEFPPVDEIVDTSVLNTRLAQGFPQPARATLSVVYLGTATYPITVIRDSELDEQSTATLKEMVDSTLRVGELTGIPWSIRLRIATGGEISYEIDRSEYCPPHMIQSPVMTTMESEVVSGYEVAELRQRIQEANDRARRMRQYRAKCLITSDGEVASLEIVKSSGNNEDDISVSNLLRGATFRTASLDGVPVIGWWVGNPIPSR